MVMKEIDAALVQAKRYGEQLRQLKDIQSPDFHLIKTAYWMFLAQFGTEPIGRYVRRAFYRAYYREPLETMLNKNLAYAKLYLVK